MTKYNCLKISGHPDIAGFYDVEDFTDIINDSNDDILEYIVDHTFDDEFHMDINDMKFLFAFCHSDNCKKISINVNGYPVTIEKLTKKVSISYV